MCANVRAIRFFFEILTFFVIICGMDKNPTFDADGYPAEETMLAIKNWDFKNILGWLQYVREAWDHTHGKIWEENGLLKMATGGWSGNEEIVSAMQENLALWGLLWESSHRGGLDVFNVSNAALQPRGRERDKDE